MNILTAGQRAFSGVNMTTKASLLPDDIVQEMVNCDRTVDGLLTTRHGSRKVNVPGTGPIQGMGYYDVITEETLYIVRGGVLYATQFDFVTNRLYDAWTVTTSGVPTLPLGTRCDFVQYFGSLYLLCAGVMYRYDGTTWSTVTDCPQTNSMMPVDTRLAVSQTAALRDALTFSDAGDGTSYDEILNQIRLSTGNDDPIVCLAPPMDSWLVVFKQNSIWAVNADSIAFLQGDGTTSATSLKRDVLVNNVGIVGPRALVIVGEQYFFMAKDGLRILQRTADSQRMGVDTPLSSPALDRLISRINRAYAHKTCMVYFDNLVLCSIAIDGSTVPNVTIVYNTQSRQFCGVWQASPTATETTWQPVCWARPQPQGRELILWGQENGELWQYLQDDASFDTDGADKIFTKVTTKAFDFGAVFEQKQLRQLQAEFANSAADASVYVVKDGDTANRVNMGTLTTAPEAVTVPAILPIAFGQATNRHSLGMLHVGRCREAAIQFEANGRIRLRETLLQARPTSNYIQQGT